MKNDSKVIENRTVETFLVSQAPLKYRGDNFDPKISLTFGIFALRKSCRQSNRWPCGARWVSTPSTRELARTHQRLDLSNGPQLGRGGSQTLGRAPYWSHVGACQVFWPGAPAGQLWIPVRYTTFEMYCHSNWARKNPVNVEFTISLRHTVRCKINFNDFSGLFWVPRFYKNGFYC